QRVSALEQEHQPAPGDLLCKGLHRAAHRREPTLGAEHAAQRIVLVRVEPGRDDDQVRPEGERDGKEELVEGGTEVGVAPPGGEGRLRVWRAAAGSRISWAAPVPG